MVFVGTAFWPSAVFGLTPKSPLPRARGLKNAACLPSPLGEGLGGEAIFLGQSAGSKRGTRQHPHAAPGSSLWTYQYISVPVLQYPGCLLTVNLARKVFTFQFGYSVRSWGIPDLTLRAIGRLAEGDVTRWIVFVTHVELAFLPIRSFCTF